MPSSDSRIRAVESGLLPVVRIAGRDTHWTIAERLAHYRCPGVSVAVVEGGELAWARGYGVRESGSAVAVDADTVFMGASISKPVTALLVLQHVERGVLDLDVDINRYLKRWQLPANEFTRGNPVTLRRILSHTAGLNVNGWPSVLRGRPVPTALNLLDGTLHTELPLLSNERREPPVRVNKAPGGSERYSGGGFLLAEMAIEDMTGRSFAELAAALIFEPLGMRRTSFEQPLPARLQDNVASGHNDSGKPLPGGWMQSPAPGAGGIYTTAPDYARFHVGCRAVLRRDLAEQMMTRQGATTFGLGWRVLGDGAARHFNHGGSNDGYQCETNCYLESGNGGVVLTNAVAGLFLFPEVMNALADVYAWPGFMPPAKRIVALSPEEQARYVGEYRIESGIELPLLRVWIEDGVLKSEIPGLRAGVQEVLIDEHGVMCTHSGPYETRVTFGPDGRAQQLIAYEAGVNEILRATRR
jgi:CubicO group peptidase (beta-lactamase class C family)